MAQELAPIDISTIPELAHLVDELQRTHQPRVLRRGNEDVAVLMPATPATRPSPSRRAHTNWAVTPDEALAIARRTAGALHQYRRVPPLSRLEEQEAFAQAVADEVAERMGA